MDPSNPRPETPNDPAFFDGDAPKVSIALAEPINWLLAFGDNDWMLWALTSQPEVPEVRVRLSPRGERITITGVAVLADEDETVNASNLRDLPLGRLETALNQRRLAAHIRYLRVAPGVTTGFDFSPNHDDIDWTLFGRTPATITTAYEIPGVKATRRPDTFYAAVADAWTSAILNQEPSPTDAIAQANGASTSAVNRWIREARKRGVMAPSSRAATAKPDKT